MITTQLRRRAAAAVLSLAAVFATTAAAAPAKAPAPRDCPVQFDDPIKAAVDKRVEVDRITPDPVWRKSCGTLYRSDGRGPEIVFAEGFKPKDVIDGQYDIEKYVLVNQPSPYVSTTY